MTLLGSDVPLTERHDVVLVDLDGVVYRGPDAVPGAVDALRTARERQRALFVTNNAAREPQEVAAHLTALGVPAEAADVVTAAQAAAALLRERLPAGAKVLVVGGRGLAAAVRDTGLEVVGSAAEGPAAVVQGFAPDIGWRDLAEATYAVRAGAWYVASNLDITLPNERGLAPGNGALVEVVRAATGATPVSAGKPQPGMFRLAAERVGARRPIVVGDRLDTDLAGARAAGYPGLMVLSGVHGGRDAVLATVHERPDYLGADLRSLLDPHPAPVQDGAWWVCGAARARVVDGAVQLEQRSGGGDGLDGLRATCAAVWSAVDRGVAVDPGSVPPFDDLVRSPGATAPSDRSDGASPFTVRGDVPAPAVHRPRGRGPAG